MKIQTELASGCKKLGIDANCYQLELFERYLALLRKWNRAYNLVGTSDQYELLHKHLLDSVAIAPYIKLGPILDVGSGAGLPGIPLAITLPQLSFVLLDANGKKTRFIRQAMIELDLNNVQVEHGRVENYCPSNLPKTVISRAFAPVDQALTMLNSVCANEGQVLIMLGERIMLPKLGPDTKMMSSELITINGLPSQRHLLVMKKQ